MKQRNLVFGLVTAAVLGSIGVVLVTAAGKKSSVVAPSAQAKTAVAPQGTDQRAIKVTFIELGSVNCVPCKMMQPVMEEIEREYGDQVKVVFHDVWTKEGQPYGSAYKIRGIPTQIFLDKDGKEFFRHTGFYPKDEIVKVLQQQGVTANRKKTTAEEPSSSPSERSGVRSGQTCP